MDGRENRPPGEHQLHVVTSSSDRMCCQESYAIPRSSSKFKHEDAQGTNKAGNREINITRLSCQSASQPARQALTHLCECVVQVPRQQHELQPKAHTETDRVIERQRKRQKETERDRERLSEWEREMRGEREGKQKDRMLKSRLTRL